MSTETDQLGPSHAATVVLDIGGDVGALVIHTPKSLLHAEIEISPADDTAADVFQAHAHTHPNAEHAGHTHDGPPRTHVAVRERLSKSGVRYAAIYPGLRAGCYTVWGIDGATTGTVLVVGGEVTELDWR
jgi:hypothetical protein